MSVTDGGDNGDAAAETSVVPPHLKELLTKSQDVCLMSTP
jgi:hypothetical protein